MADDAASHPRPAGHGLSLAVSHAMDDYPAALLSGVLGRREAGCLMLGAHVVLAPPGSSVTSARTVHLTGYGDLALGDELLAGGGLIPADFAADLAVSGAWCLEGQDTVALLAPGEHS